MYAIFYNSSRGECHEIAIRHTLDSAVDFCKKETASCDIFDGGDNDRLPYFRLEVYSHNWHPGDEPDYATPYFWED